MARTYCTRCGHHVFPDQRARLGYNTCLPCGEQSARKVRHTIVPMHKSNYVVVSDLRDLKGINNKGGFYR